LLLLEHACSTHDLYDLESDNNSDSDAEAEDEDSIYNDLKVWGPGSKIKQGVEPGLDTGMNQIDFICFERSNLCFFLVWFNQPKHMPDWLYQFFGDVVKPLLFAKNIHKQS
jgi:hypothetical protein